MILRFASIVVAACGMVSTANAQVLTYNASLGTTPQNQGWTVGGSLGNPTAGTVSGGALRYGPTVFADTLFWSHNPSGGANFATTAWSIEFDLRLTNTTYGNVSGFRRGGFSVTFQDDFGRWIALDAGSAGLGIRNDSNGTTDPTTATNLATAFHTIRVQAGPSGAELYLDGSLIQTLSLGSGLSGAASVNWGEGSILASTTLTEIRSVALIPTPGAAALLGLGGLIAARRRRS